MLVRFLDFPFFIENLGKGGDYSPAASYLFLGLFEYAVYKLNM